MLAERAPALYYIHVAAFFDAVWIALRDAKLHIRVAAVDALRSTLLLVKTKETRMKATWYKQLLEVRGADAIRYTVDCQGAR